MEGPKENDIRSKYLKVEVGSGIGKPKIKNQVSKTRNEN